MTADITELYPFDHAAKGETSLMMALCPEAVDMRQFSAKTWYTRTASEASAELGARGRDLILAHVRRVLVASKLSPAAAKP
jgi:creatinine amidohydrolase/Fe(II)-dependent formamide hydrolase-like protein